MFAPLDFSLTNQSTLPIYLLVFSLPILLSQKMWSSTPSSFFLLATTFMITNALSKTVKAIQSPMSTIMIHSSFYIVIMLNLMGLIPFITSMTVHLSVTLSIGLSMWLALTSHTAVLSPKMATTLQVPENSPVQISRFLSSVESVSNIIRPITLSFRLAANITAGHIILAMMSSSILSSLLTVMVILLPVLLMSGAGYFAFEITIALIQAFVLTLLVFMYSNDYTPIYTQNLQTQ